MKAASLPGKTGKQPLTDREKACIICGYMGRIAEESKEEGLFKDLSVEEVMWFIFNTKPHAKI